MKFIHTLPLTIATVCLTFTGCDKKTADTDSAKPAAPAPAPAPKPAAVDEKTSIANFKTEVETVGKWIEERQKTAGADPAAGAAMVGEIVAKLKAVKTDGLPADLKAAWGDMNGVLAEMGDVFKSMPKVDPAKPEDAGKVMGEFMPKVMAVQAKVAPVAAKLEEIGKKYGLDMTKVAPGK